MRLFLFELLVGSGSTNTGISSADFEEDGFDDCDATSTCHGLSFGPRLRCGVERSIGISGKLAAALPAREEDEGLEDKLLSDVPASLALIVLLGSFLKTY